MCCILGAVVTDTRGQLLLMVLSLRRGIVRLLLLLLALLHRHWLLQLVHFRRLLRGSLRFLTR
jgi:hypothetical protein